MPEFHDEHEDLYQDEDMIEYGSDTKHVSSPYGTSGDVSDNERVLATYESGSWLVESQVNIDGEWYVARRSTLENPPNDAQEFTASGKPVRQNYGLFTRLSIPARILAAPIYGIYIMYLCIKGSDINLQVLEK